MRHYARQPEPEVTFGRLIRLGAAAAGAAILRNPVAVGGTTAFLVSLAFVSANALWYQPHFHGGALLSTRAPAMPILVEEVETEVPAPRPARAEEPAATSNETTGAVAPQETADAETPTGDPTVRRVQTVLSDLDLYRGTVDGLSGPQTSAAIENYRRIVGLSAGEAIDDQLLHHLGLAENKEEARVELPERVPAPTPRPQPHEAGTPQPSPDAGESRDAAGADVAASPAADDQIRTASLVEPDPTVIRVQAGLRAFGNESIQIDGVMGDKTSMAIREFQSLFGLPVNGEVDTALVQKMQEVGLIN